MANEITFTLTQTLHCAIIAPTIMEGLKMSDIDDTIQRLREELAVLQRAKAIIRSKTPIGAGEAPTGKGRDSIKPDSDPGRAWAVLREAGGPLHVFDIMSAIEKQTGKAPVRSSLVSALARYSKNKRIFYRAKPNTFGLLEWKSETNKITE